MGTTPNDSITELERQFTDDTTSKTVQIGGPGIPTHTLDFVPGVTVGEWLEHAGIILKDGQIANVSGRRADLGDILTEPANITVAGKVVNG